MRNKKIALALALILLGSFVLTGSAYAYFTEPTTSTGWDPSTLSVFKLPEGTIYNIIENVLSWILAIVGFIALIAFAIAGIMYLTAAGDDERMKTAKNAMTYSIIGVIVALSGLVVIWAADSMLNASALF